MLPGVVGGDKPRMVQPGQDHRFAVPGLLPADTDAGVGTEDLDRYRSSQPQIETSVDVRSTA
ncbi:hypothetical protein ADK82_32200 [Streptomyces sp. NRRL S-4]|nr:hypothetical protein ADK82_32200 [Streptomyces sp. NRRL S-4]